MDNDNRQLQECFPDQAAALVFAKSVANGDNPPFKHDGCLSIIKSQLTVDNQNKTVFYVEDGCPMIRMWEQLIWEWTPESGETTHLSTF